jgi:hypothetical protein
MTPELLNPEKNITEVDIRHLVIEDDTPVDNFQSELQQRLLVEPIYSAKALPPLFWQLVTWDYFINSTSGQLS